MKLLLAGLLTASTLTITAPAMAQSVYIGPNGSVGVGIGARPYGGYYRDGYRRGPVYEGRSVYRGDREFRRGDDGFRNGGRGFRGDR